MAGALRNTPATYINSRKDFAAELCYEMRNLLLTLNRTNKLTERDIYNVAIYIENFLNTKRRRIDLQAIQYSMETTYYTEMMAKSSDGMPSTSVIHTAPKCTSVIDSDHEDCSERYAVTAPSPSRTTRQLSEEWTPSGSFAWNNSQLRLMLSDQRSNSGINVCFIYDCLKNASFLHFDHL